MSSKKRSIKVVPNVNEERLLEGIYGIPDKELQAYIAFLYLFGNRVSEGIGIPKTEIVGYYKYIRKSKQGTKEVSIPKRRLLKNSEGEKEWEVEPLKTWQIEYDHIKKILHCRNVPTFKTAGRPFRDVWVLADGPGEEKLCELLYAHTKRKREEGEMSYLFNLDRRRVYNATRKYLGVNAFPHKLRDLRATKDATTYGLDVKDLQEKFNWARPDMALYYGRKNRTDIIHKMRRSVPLHHTPNAGQESNDQASHETNGTDQQK